MNESMAATPKVNKVTILVGLFLAFTLLVLVVIDGYNSLIHHQGIAYSVAFAVFSLDTDYVVGGGIPEIPLIFWSFMVSGFFSFLIYVSGWIIVKYLSQRNTSLKSIVFDAIKRNW